jgi:prophage maintenance system killer protein
MTNAEDSADGERRITEVSLEVGDVIRTNMEFFRDDEKEYEDAHAFTHLDTRRKIKLGEGKRNDLSKVIEEFPTNEPLASQSALWMRAIVGLHFFPDANHRTAMATLRGMMKDNGIETFETSGDVEEMTVKVLDRSKELRRHEVDVDMGNYYEKDGLYEAWLDYFENVL